METADDLLTLTEAAAYARVTRGTVRRWVKAGKLRLQFRPSGRPLVRRGDLVATDPEEFARRAGVIR